MKKLLGIIIIGLLVSNSSYAAKQCTAEDEAYVIEMNSDDYGTKVSTEEAYEFGLSIINAVKEKNLDKLMSYITHKKSFTTSNKDLDIENYKEKKFENIFSKEWISLIVDSLPICRSMGYKGWMLGSGMIWYQYSRDLVEKNEDEPWKNKYKNKSLTISHINNP